MSNAKYKFFVGYLPCSLLGLTLLFILLASFANTMLAVMIFWPLFLYLSGPFLFVQLTIFLLPIRDKGNKNKFFVNASIATCLNAIVGVPLLIAILVGVSKLPWIAGYLKQPRIIVVDKVGNVYIDDLGPQYQESRWDAIYKVSNRGYVSKFAEQVRVKDSLGGMVVDQSGNLFISDWNDHAVKRITPSGEVSIFAGTSGVVGFKDGLREKALFSAPGAMAIDGNKNLYLIDRGNHVIRKVDAKGYVTTLIFKKDGLKTNQLDAYDISADIDGNLTVISDDGQRIDSIDKNGTLKNLAASTERWRFLSIVRDDLGDHFAIDQGNKIIKISHSGAISEYINTVAINTDWIHCLALDKQGNLYTLGRYNHTLYKITPQKEVTKLMR
ncbi:hypothetical protein ACUHMQ_10445 [Chitinimonas sp. PSY-7]|uniref:hypothetical protein n=1 Tax=Chitinimonas sp. PSY-7 TaxID=3459088 RepID=UPI004040255D